MTRASGPQDASDPGPPAGAAGLVRMLCPPPARVLIAGSGEGLLASRLMTEGYRALGADDDARAVAAARARDPRTPVVRSTGVDPLPVPSTGAVVLAGERITSAWSGRLAGLIAALATHVGGTGWLIVELDFDAGPDRDALEFTAYDRLCAAAGLSYVARYRDWHGTPGAPPTGRTIVVHRRG